MKKSIQKNIDFIIDEFYSMAPKYRTKKTLKRMLKKYLHNRKEL